jgi:hypothetical protein
VCKGQGTIGHEVLRKAYQHGTTKHGTT